MTGIAKQWLCILLACLLGIAPLGRALAEVHTPQPPQAMTQVHANHHTHPASTAPACDKCDIAQSCDGQDCPCSQCASCITSFLPMLLDIHFETLSQEVPSSEHGPTRDTASLLFRPPRS